VTAGTPGTATSGQALWESLRATAPLEFGEDRLFETWGELPAKRRERLEAAASAAIDVFLAGDSVSAESIREAIAAQQAQPAPEPPFPGDPVAVLDDGEVLAMRACSGGVIVIAFAPGAPVENAARLRDAMAAQCDVPVIAVAALRAWEPAEIAVHPQPAPGDRAFRADLVDAMLLWSGRDRADVDECARELAAILDKHPIAQPAPEADDVRPREGDPRMKDITCGSCGEEFGTNADDDEIECTECDARRCPHCKRWFGGQS
jgi:hypothetical protein